MSLALQPGHGVARGLRRIAGRRVERARRLAAERPDGVADAVHRCRRQCKAVRALIRLVEPAFGDAREENAAFRDAARSLSGDRDREVMFQTAESLARPLRTTASRASVERVVAALSAARGRRDDGEVVRLLGAFADAMAEASARVEGWTLDAQGFDAIEGGLTGRYALARRAMRRARRGDGDAETTFHDWRKRTKEHEHHLRVLTPAWPRPLKAARREASLLADLQGEHHDLLLLHAALSREPERYGGAGGVDALLAAATARRLTLEPAMFALGDRLFAVTPRDMAERLKRYWRAGRAKRRAGRPA